MKTSVLIIGGGVTGLAAARCLKVEAALYEKEEELGGCLRSDKVDGYTIDRTGHVLHFNDAYARRLMLDELPVEWIHSRRLAEIHILNCRVPFPIQYNLWALPEAVRSRCIISYLETGGKQPDPCDSFERWSRLSYGDHLHELFFEPYNRKLWQADLGAMSAEWAERFMPLPVSDLVVDGVSGKNRGKAFGYNSTFIYPRRGGSQVITSALASGLDIPIHAGVELKHIDLDSKLCEFSNGALVRYDKLISTIPLPRLLECIHPCDEEIAARGRTLRHNSVLYLALGYRTNGRPAPPQHWVYLPEVAYLPYRVGVLSNYSPEVAPSGAVLLCAEIAFPSAEVGSVDRYRLRSRVLGDLESLGIVHPDWTLEVEHFGAIECAYVIFDSARREALPRIREYLNRHGIYSIGRYGAWTYGSVQDALFEGRDCADSLNKEFGSVGPVSPVRA